MNDTASREIATQFTPVDANAIDGGRSLAYVKEKGTLSIIHFDRPLTSEAELWEQLNENR